MLLSYFLGEIAAELKKNIDEATVDACLASTSVGLHGGLDYMDGRATIII